MRRLTVLESYVDEAGRTRDPHEQNLHPTWSPDGWQVVFLNGGGLSAINADGSDERLLVPTVDSTPVYVNDDPPNHSVEWSPDGALLAFVAKKTVADGNETFAFYTVRPDGSALTQIAFFEYIVWADDNMLAWSPDGAWLAFTDHLSVYVARPDGTEVRKIADGIAGKSASIGLRWYGRRMGRKCGSAILTIA